MDQTRPTRESCSAITLVALAVAIAALLVM